MRDNLSMSWEEVLFYQFQWLVSDSDNVDGVSDSINVDEVCLDGSSGCFKLFWQILTNFGKHKTEIITGINKSREYRFISKKSDKTVDEINRNKPTNMDKTSAQNIDSDLDKYLSSFSSTILLLVVGYPDMCSHPPLVSLSLTPKPLRCDLNAGDPMTIHQKERANA